MQNKYEVAENLNDNYFTKYSDSSYKKTHQSLNSDSKFLSNGKSIKTNTPTSKKNIVTTDSVSTKTDSTKKSLSNNFNRFTKKLNFSSHVKKSWMKSPSNSDFSEKSQNKD